MTSFADRERGFEAQFARDAELQFRVMARRDRLLGVWAAQQLGLAAEETEAYAKTVVQADFKEAGDEDVIRKVCADLASKGLSEHEVRQALVHCAAEARRQIMEAI